MMLIASHSEDGTQLGGKLPRGLARVKLGDDGWSSKCAGFTINTWLTEVKVLVMEKVRGRLGNLGILDSRSWGQIWGMKETDLITDLCAMGGTKGIVDGRLKDPWALGLERWENCRSPDFG